MELDGARADFLAGFQVVRVVSLLWQDVSTRSVPDRKIIAERCGLFGPLPREHGSIECQNPVNQPLPS